MLGRAAGAAAGVVAALRSPRWLRRDKLIQLMSDPAPIRATGLDRAPHAVRAAHATLRLLGRVAFPVWRNTCLYRAVAECLALRRYGIPCRLELGVGRPDEPGRVTAHAWVARADGVGKATSPVAIAVLR